MLHTLVATVENRPGVLNRVSSLFRRRNFNIASLTVCQTENPAVSRMTIVVDTKMTKPHIVTENLYKMVNVLDVQDMTGHRSVQRDLALVKVQTNASTRGEIMQFAELYRAKIVNVTHDSLILEMTGEPAEVDNFIEVIRPFGIVEMGRAGSIAMRAGNGEANGYANGHARTADYVEPLAEREGV